MRSALILLWLSTTARSLELRSRAYPPAPAAANASNDVFVFAPAAATSPPPVSGLSAAPNVTDVMAPAPAPGPAPGLVATPAASVVPVGPAPAPVIAASPAGVGEPANETAIEAGLMPALMWVRRLTETLAPLTQEQCCGCRCLRVDASKFMQSGAITREYLCKEQSATPNVSWSYDMTGKDGDSAKCRDVEAWGMTVVDLDYPGGVGESDNSVRNLFWAIDIPASWRQFGDSNAFLTESGIPAVTIGMNSYSQSRLEPPCPPRGAHRYRLTLYALSRYLGGEVVPSINTPYPQVSSSLEQYALAKVSVVAQAMR